MRDVSVAYWLRRIAVPVMLALGLASCGGSGSTGGGESLAPDANTPAIPSGISEADAARLLTQATFGPTDAEIDAVIESGYAGWIDQQFAAQSASHLVYLDNRLAQLKLTNPAAIINRGLFYESFWLNAVTGKAQLRERMKLALSEIFVISLMDPNLDVRGAGAYYDMLGANAFGNYRTLLEQVALHPMMGRYLSHVGNQKEDPATGRNPDENFAREVLQLMSIGVNELNMDGTVRRDADNRPIPSYTQSDISSLARVFTGFSWYAATPTNSSFMGGGRTLDSYVRPMIPYANYHSTSAKTVLGKTIPPGSTDAAAELKIALDAIANHPNVPPFICKQLIQRLVTSNPTPAYVAHCSASFVNNGSGVRGDLAEVVRSILLYKEARALTAVSGTTGGKLREPVIRMTNWMRAFGATSVSGNFMMDSTSANTSLGQTALAAPSVFNFFRPGYVPPNTRLGAQNLTAPEFQIVDEVTVAGYANAMQKAIGTGTGLGWDVKSSYAREVAIAANANALADRMNRLLLYGTMSSTLRARLVESINSVAVPAANGSNRAQVEAALLNRSKLAIYMTMISPDYLVQR